MMPHRLFVSSLILAVVGMSVCGVSAEDKKAKVLFVSQSAGYRHGSVNRGKKELAPAEIAMTQLGQQTGLFEVHCTQDCAADFTRENLQNYDMVSSPVRANRAPAPLLVLCAVCKKAQARCCGAGALFALTGELTMS